MKAWFTSLNGAITLSAAALVIQLFRAFLDFAIEFPKFVNDNIAVVAIVYAVIFGVWGAGLLAARTGRRAGVVTALVVGLLFWLGLDLTTTLPILCPEGCSTILFNVAAAAGLVVGGPALIALALQLARRPAPATVPGD